MDEVLRRSHAVPGGPWPGNGHSFQVVGVDAWHVKCDVQEKPHGAEPSSWLSAQHPTVVVRVRTAAGHIGWGEAMGVGGCGEAVKATIETMVAPLLLPEQQARGVSNSLAKQAHDQSVASSPDIAASSVSDIEATMRRLQQALHLQGRYGITMFALSGVEIALWDLAAKLHGKPLCQLLRGVCGVSEPRKQLPVYASLMRYSEPSAVANVCRAVKEAGYSAVKLHEITEEAVAVAREAVGADMKLMVDTNCPWSPPEARVSTQWMRKYGVYWLEEPVYPPEDFSSLSELQRMAASEIGVDIAAGENACTAFEFAKMLEAGAVRFAQPSVIKCGGIAECCRIAQLAETLSRIRESPVSIVPWSFCPGPGFLATLHIAAVIAPNDSGMMVERIFADYKDTLFPQMHLGISDGMIQVPTDPGLGYDVDLATLQRIEVTLEADLAKL